MRITGNERERQNIGQAAAKALPQPAAKYAAQVRKRAYLFLLPRSCPGLLHPPGRLSSLSSLSPHLGGAKEQGVSLELHAAHAPNCTRQRHQQHDTHDLRGGGHKRGVGGGGGGGDMSRDMSRNMSRGACFRGGYQPSPVRGDARAVQPAPCYAFLLLQRAASSAPTARQMPANAPSPKRLQTNHGEPLPEPHPGAVLDIMQGVTKRSPRRCARHYARRYKGSPRRCA